MLQTVDSIVILDILKIPKLQAFEGLELKRSNLKVEPLDSCSQGTLGRRGGDKNVSLRLKSICVLSLETFVFLSLHICNEEEEEAENEKKSLF